MKRESVDMGSIQPFLKSAAPSRNIASTVNRNFHGQDHMPPRGKHASGHGSQVWHGHRRVLNPGALRRKNVRTWRRLTIQGRSLAASAAEVAE